jgi:hypothetical protein
MLTFDNKSGASPVKQNRSPDKCYVDEERSKWQKVPEVVVPAESE